MPDYASKMGYIKELASSIKQCRYATCTIMTPGANCPAKSEPVLACATPSGVVVHLKLRGHFLFGRQPCCSPRVPEPEHMKA